MDIKYPIENEYMKCVLQINGFSGPRPRVKSSPVVGSGQVRSGGATFELYCFNSPPIFVCFSSSIFFFSFLFYSSSFPLLRVTAIQSLGFFLEPLEMTSFD